MTQPLTAKATERDPSLPADSRNYSDSSDDTHKNLGKSLLGLLLNISHYRTDLCNVQRSKNQSEK